MKFADLPIGTKFIDDIGLCDNTYNYLVKISNVSYSYNDNFSEWMWCWYTTDVYPVLEWEDECTTL